MEVCFGGAWGTVCDDSWGLLDATLLKMWCYCNTQKWGKTIVPNMALIYGVITAPDFSVIKTLILEL